MSDMDGIIPPRIPIDRIDNIEAKINGLTPVVQTISESIQSFKQKPALVPLDINNDGVIDQKERQIYDYYNNSMEKMQAHYIWGRVIDTLFTLGLVLLSIFAF